MHFVFAAAGPPLTDELREEREPPLRAGISCVARPTYAVGSQQYWEYCMTFFRKDGGGNAREPRTW